MKEIISIPAAKTQDIIKKYLIHAHPHPRNYKDAQYITFRKVGGVMDTLYSVQLDLVLQPKKQDIENQVKHLNSDYKSRLIGYIHERKFTFGFDEGEEYKFYILKVEQCLEHLPKPKGRNLQSHTYYTLDELTSGKREVIRESQISR